MLNVASCLEMLRRVMQSRGKRILDDSLNECRYVCYSFRHAKMKWIKLKFYEDIICNAVIVWE